MGVIHQWIILFQKEGREDHAEIINVKYSWLRVGESFWLWLCLWQRAKESEEILSRPESVTRDGGRSRTLQDVDYGHHNLWVKIVILSQDALGLSHY